MNHRDAGTPSLNLVPRDGVVLLFDGFIPPGRVHGLFEILKTELAWHQEMLQISGRTVKVPRLVCFYGDEGANYRYSGVVHRPMPWTEALSHIKRRVEAQTQRRYNCVLGNYYRDGMDSMGWHADREPELGEEPSIASVSLGASRRFLLRHNRTAEQVNLTLMDGSLLLMAGTLQHHWRHCVPKTRVVTGERINLTFRRVWDES